MEDAPQGHLAWARVRSKDWKNETFIFIFQGADGQKIEFRTTLHASGGNIDEALRIARLCYVKFEEGCSKDDVVKFRDALYRQVTGRANSLAEPAVDENISEAPQDDQEAERAAKKRKKEPLPASGEDTSKFAQEAAADLENLDVPSTVVVKKQMVGQALICVFPGQGFVRDGKKIPLQTTLKACGGDEELMQRILRLCWVKLEAGWSKEDVVKYRNEIYAIVAADPERAVQPRTAAAEDAAAAVTTPTAPSSGTAQPEPVAGATRAAPRRAASAVDAQAIPELQPSPDSQVLLNGRPRAAKLTFSRREKNGNVMFKFLYNRDGARIPFQITASRCGGDEAAAGRIVALCYDKFVAGWSKDDVMKYREELCDELGSAATAAGREPPPSKSKVDRPRDASATKKKQDDTVDQSSSGSDSESSSTASSAKPEAPKASEPRANTPSTSPVVLPPSAAAPPALAAAKVAAAIAGKRVCAKMLVTSGLRCACHFAPAAMCQRVAGPA